MHSTFRMIWIIFVAGRKNGNCALMPVSVNIYLQHGNASTYEYYMDEEESRSKLTIVSSQKDLGMWITSKPDFSLQCDKASAKTMQSLGLIKRTFNHLTSESFLLYTKLISAHI